MSSFSKRRKDGSIWSKKPQDNSTSNLPLLYLDLSLPLNLFIKCIVSGDLSALVISGTPKTEDIAAAWAGIYSKYLDLNYDNEEVYILELQRDIVLLSSHIIEVETCLYFLSSVYHEGLIDILHNNGYTDTSDLAIIQNRLSRKKLDMASKTKEYDDYTKSHENDEVTEKYFITWLFRLAKYQGVAIIRPKDITVQEFVLLMQDYLAFINSQKTDLDANER